MRINILLPYKEKFDKDKASSVSITILNNLYYSKFQKNIKIFGQKVKQPSFKDNFEGISYSIFSLTSRNKFLAKKMSSSIIKSKEKKQIIEIHNRPYLVDFLAQANQFPISLFLHNDPLEMRGSKLLKERENILKKCEVIFCVSEFIKNQFLKGVLKNHNKVKVLYNGVDRKLKKFPCKKKEVLFVGRLVAEKGVELYVDAIKSIANYFPDWNFGIIGSFKLGDNQKSNLYARGVINKFNKIGSQTTYYGFQNKSFVEEKMKSASIIVIPSIWQEPFGLVAAEAMSNGIAIIASNVGGIPEIVKDNGILINNINSIKITKSLKKLIEDYKLRLKYQKKAWKNFDFRSSVSSARLDNFRKKIFQKNF